MTTEEAEYVQIKMDNEGFDYTFRFYSDFGEIKDSEFHKLRLQYIEVATELENFIQTKLISWK